MPRGLICAAHVHDTTVPQERHHVQPLSRGGPNTKANLVVICCNAHSDAHYLLDLIEDAGGYPLVPEAVKRTFGYGVRRIALQGWAAYADRFLAGHLWREVKLWNSAGLPRSPLVPTFSHAAATVDRLAAEDMHASPDYVEWCRARYLPVSPSDSH